MGKIKKLTNLTSLKTPQEFMRHGSQAISDIANNVNGNLTFDENLATNSVSVTFLKANTDQAVAHGLGKVPTGFIPSAPSAACTVFLGSKPADAQVIYLQSTAPATVLLIFH